MNGFFLTGKQFRCHGHIVNVRGCNLQGMHQPSVFVDPNVRLIAEMPGVPLLRRMGLWVAFLFRVFGA